jgi:hypothetical protein
VRIAAVALVVAATVRGRPPEVIDAFESIAAWEARPADGVTMRLTADSGFRGRALRIDFDFHGGGGYAVAHRAIDLALPPNYEIAFRIRGNSQPNTLEMKLVDSTGDNVWWSNQQRFEFPAAWREVVRKKRHVTFAWGPAGGGELHRAKAIEFAITAGTGGKGTVWLDELELRPLEPDRPYDLVPNVSATSSRTSPQYAMDGDTNTSWRAPGSLQTLTIDFKRRREFGGLVLDWEPGRHASDYVVETSRDSAEWTTAYTVARGNGGRDYLFLPESDARLVRLRLLRGAPAYALREVTVEPLAWSASLNDFFAAVATDAPRGSYPKYLTGRQSYWTVAGTDHDREEALINEEGAIEIGQGRPSIEPFLFVNGRLITWADVDSTTQSLDAELPHPKVVWHSGPISLAITAIATGAADSSVVRVRYEVRSPQSVRLYLALRPFQVNPSWQFLGGGGGVAPAREIRRVGDTVRVDSARAFVALTNPARFAAATFDEGDITDCLRRGALPSSDVARDVFGHASAAMQFDLTRDSSVEIAIPLHRASRSSATPWATVLARSTRAWRARFDRVHIELPRSASRITQTLYANLAYILINRDGPALQPGSRAYSRSWIRDGSLEATALLRLGQTDAAREFLEWYAKFQYQNGKVPCCVDHRGADPVPEHDSNGEFIYLAAEYWRHTGDRAMVERLWPRIVRAVAYLDSLRHSEMGGDSLFAGLLPPSISHEGYSAKPMHSYWDDFFALRGFKDAATLAQALGKPEAPRFATIRDEFRRDFYRSIERAMQRHHIDFIPGAADLGDFDATSTTIALSPVGELGRLPRAAVERTFERYWTEFVARRDGANAWEAYTPYELRTVGSMVRLGSRERAVALLDFFFTHQRPAGWHHWAEVVWRDPAAPKFIGDMPHTWVGSDYIRSVLDMLAYEREEDSSLVIGAGVPDEWLDAEPGVVVRNLSTHYGPLSFTMRRVGGNVRVRLERGVRIPPGGIVVDSIRVRELPATVTTSLKRTAIRPNHVRVEAPTRLDRPLLRLVVDVNDPEPARVAEAPLVVVEQRPGEVAAQIRSRAHRVVCSPKMVAIIGHAQRIFDATIDRFGRIVKRGAILRDVQRRIAVPIPHPQQHPRERRRKNLPASFGDRMLRLPNATCANWQRSRVVARHRARVIVDTDEVDRLANHGHVVGRELRPRLAEDLAHLVRVRAQTDRIEVLPVHVRVGALRRRLIGARSGRGILRLEIHDDADRAALRPTLAAIGEHRCAMRSHQVVCRDRGLEEIAMARSERAVEIAAIGHDPWLVERCPHGHAITERAVHHRRIVGKPVRAVAVQPSTTVIERRGQIPVVERHVRRDAIFEQRIDQSPIEVEAAFVHGATTSRQHATPRDAEAIRVEAELTHQGDVVAIPSIVIAGDIASLTVRGAPRRTREAMPDARTRTIGERRAFDLIRGRRCSPEKPVGEAIPLTHRRNGQSWLG